MDQIYVPLSIALAGLVLLGIKWMSSPRTAVRGNRLSALAMLAAILVVLWRNDILTTPLLWVAMAVGSILGYWLGIKATMIQMPQMVALLNGLGGGASALVAIAEIMDKYSELAPFNKVTSQLALIVGGLTLSGSLIAAAKLDRRMNQRPVVLAGHNIISNGMIVVMLVLTAVTLQSGPAVVPISFVIMLLSLVYGVLFAIRVGGADMPITISLLNSFSGLAGAIVGFTISEPLLVAVGAIVGASGLILTQIMCKAMNRSLGHVLSGAIAKPSAKKAGERKALPRAASAESGVETKPEEKPKQQSPGSSLKDAKKVIVIPGYGMAIAQAQGHVKRLMDALEAQGTEVDFAIHPVAGRMPGHMNVLLAEVDVPYEKLREMDDINPEFSNTDAAIIVGACDVVNPAANSAEDTPIYGMPILDADKAKHVIVCNLDTNPGYSGVDNPLYEMAHVELLLGDAKASLDTLLAVVEGRSVEGAAEPVEAGKVQDVETAGATEVDPLAKALAGAKKVIIIPGYGMAVAQAQSHVKKLMDALEEREAQVDFAIHPVAGRMPGHMNVLLAEADVPYDKLREMDDINPEFPQTDLAIIVGACDVVNPAANTAEDTPIYGMPILNADKAKFVAVCNLDTNPGYSGVDNPLYEMPHVKLLLGDAKESLNTLLKAIHELSEEAESPKNLEPGPGHAAQDEVPKSEEVPLEKILTEAKKVIVVPGYGMAIAQAQGHVKRLMDALEGRGAEVDFAIHPVAGRMPGHMNVLLAEVDVPYDKLREMDDINPEFSQTDVAIIVGACDVVNPAANDQEDTPIYGMPVLSVEEAKHVIVCNLDTNPGYSGVDNPLYEMDHVKMLLGDAKASLDTLLKMVQ